MKRIALYCLLLLVALSVSASGAEVYTVREWPGGANSSAEMINNVGQVTGRCWDREAGTTTIVLWDSSCNPSFTATGSMYSTFVPGLNNRGQFIGCLDGKWFLRNADGSMMDLSPLIPLDGWLGALNDQGWVVGASSMTDGMGTRAWVLIPGSGQVILNPLPGDTATTAADVNNRGQVIGSSSNYDAQKEHPFVWSQETGMIALQIPQDATWVQARYINDSGQILGDMSSDLGGYWLLWNADGTLVRKESGSANYINNRGQIILYSPGTDGVEFMPYILDPDGTRHALKPLPGAVSANGFQMNDNGAVIGRSYFHSIYESGPSMPCIWEPQGAVEATADITPDTLNRHAKGNYVTCLIELPDGRNLRDIKVPSLRLQGTVAPCIRRYQIGDADKDGIPDMMVKFDHAALCATLQPGPNTVTLTGEFSNGELLTGQDSVRTVPSRK